MMLLLLGLGIPYSVLSQSNSLNGIVINAQTQKAIPYASLRIEGQSYGGVTNAEGRFSLAFPEGINLKGSTLKISCIGYESKRIPLGERLSQDWRIELNEKPYSLETVTIYSVDLDARMMVRQALQYIPLNYAQTPYQLQSFYRHYCREGERYGRLIEAVVELNDVGGHDRFFRTPERKLEMRLVQLRRSFDFTRFSAYQHIPIALNRSLLADIVSYQSLLSRHLHNSKFEFVYQDTTYYDSEVVFVIGVSGKAEGLQFEAQLYIQASDFAIVRVDHRYSSQRSQKTWRYQREDHFVADYRKHEGKYYLNYLLNEGQYNEQQLDSMGLVVYANDHNHHVEMMTQQIRTEGFEVFKGKEPSADEMAKIPYKPSFWDSYSVLTATPLESQIENDLTSRMPLKQQFTGDMLPVNIQDQLAKEHFEQWLEKQKGRLVVVGFWDSQYDPGIREILKARRLMNQFQETPFSTLLISTDKTEQSWQEAIRKKRLYGVDHLRLGLGLDSPLCQDLRVASVPYFVVYGPSGERLHQGQSLPNKSEVGSFLGQ